MRPIRINLISILYARNVSIPQVKPSEWAQPHIYLFPAVSHTSAKNAGKYRIQILEIKKCWST